MYDIHDIRTQKQRERDNRNVRIRGEYAKLREELPEASNARLFEAIAKRYSLTMQTVRNIILENA